MLLTDAPAASYVPSRLRTIDCWSSLCQYRIRQWVQTCTGTHQHPTPPTTLPTRILDVGTDRAAPTVHLVDGSSAPPGPYIALSHCWGTSHRIITTQSTLAHHQSGIDIDSLPKTFAEAVHISRLLGVRYLWIDTLCIIQDSTTDWETESSRMGSVYANSLLCIAASSSRDDESGVIPSIQVRQGAAHISPDAMSMLLPSLADVPPYLVERPGQEPVYLSRQTMVPLTSHEPNPQNRPSNLIITKEWMPSSNRSAPLTYKIGKFGRIFDPLEDEPLNSRAWTLQERLLAPRTLHYGSHQVFWECALGLWAEDGTPFPNVFFTLDGVLAKQRIPWEHHGLPVQGAGMNLVEGLYHNTPRHGRWDGGWLALVQNYSRRAITKPDDKLPAIAGLARVIADRSGDKYLAGLWYSHLEEDLCWRVYAREEMHMVRSADSTEPAPQVWGKKFTDIGAPERYRAPSWSWASVDAGVLFVQMNFDHIVAAFEGGYVEPVGEDMFGRLKAGWIQLRVSLHSSLSFPEMTRFVEIEIVMLTSDKGTTPPSPSPLTHRPPSRALWRARGNNLRSRDRARVSLPRRRRRELPLCRRAVRALPGLGKRPDRHARRW
jgi:hypothetical protein